jgi:hypothetical protein
MTNLPPPPLKLVAADIETTAFKKSASGRMILPKTVHIILCEDIESDTKYTFGPDIADLERGVRWLETCETVIFHNGIGFDLPTLELNFKLDRLKAKFLDSLVILQLLYSNIKADIDMNLFNGHKEKPPENKLHTFTGDLIGRQSIAAWGLRLKEPLCKGDYSKSMEEKGLDPWAEYNPEMLEYGKFDVTILKQVWIEFIAPRLVELHNDIPIEYGRAIEIEHRAAELMYDLKESGIKFDNDKALVLHQALLKRLQELQVELAEKYKAKLVPKKWVTHSLDEALAQSGADTQLIEDVRTILTMETEGTAEKPAPGTKINFEHMEETDPKKRYITWAKLNLMRNYDKEVRERKIAFDLKTGVKSKKARKDFAKDLKKLEQEETRRQSRLMRDYKQIENDVNTYGIGTHVVANYHPFVSLTESAFKDKSKLLHPDISGYDSAEDMRDLLTRRDLFQARLIPWGQYYFELTGNKTPSDDEVLEVIDGDYFKLIEYHAERERNYALYQEITKRLPTNIVEFIAKTTAPGPKDKPRKWEPLSTEKLQLRESFRKTEGTYTGLLKLGQQAAANKALIQLRSELLAWDKAEYPTRVMFGEVKTPKRDKIIKDKETGDTYTQLADCPYVPCTSLPFNPGSRDQIIDKLLDEGWTPTDFTDTGRPSVSEEDLQKAAITIPSAKLLADYLTVQKRISQLAEGDTAWMRLVDEDGMLRPTIRPCSTVTFRATHNSPNISAVPSVRKLKSGAIAYGESGSWNYECRELFTIPDHMDFVGVDLAGIELRCLAHRLKRYDNGALINTILNEDIHENNRIILGFADRRKAKEFLYALLYGAGDLKLGFIIDPLVSEDQMRINGREARNRFMDGLRGFSNFMDELADAARFGYLIGLDGRKVPVRSAHSALNTQLQSDGAIISKYWLDESVKIIEDKGLKKGYDKDYTLMLFVHDELDWAVRKSKDDELVHIVGMANKEGALRTQKLLNFGMEIEVGDATERYKVGRNWAECH